MIPSLVGRAPRPVFCVTDHACRSLEVARAVAAGRFTHLGQTLELGLDPDWIGARFPEDKEWRIEWSKFYFGLDLAHAYAETREHRFLEAWRRLVESWIATVPPGYDRSDVTGRRIQNWIYSWLRFRAAEAPLSEELEDQLYTSLAAQVEAVRTHLTPERNHRTLELYALFVAALALPGLDSDGALLAFAISELYRNLLTDILPDGVHREQSTHYHCVALRTFLGVRENARQFGLSLPAGFDERLEAAAQFLVHIHRPDGAIPAWSDSDTGSYQDLMSLAAGLYDRPDFRYVATAGREGRPPAQRVTSFPVGGYHLQRSGWGVAGRYADERFLMFDCGPLGDGGHGHYDLLSIEVAAYGRPLLIDPGRYSYSDAPPNWRRWFKGTAAHNTVVVDGLDQTPYRRGKPVGPPAAGCLLGQSSVAGLDWLAGEATSPAYEARHLRQILFVGGEYWLIHDRLSGQRPHRYDLRYHLAPEAQGRVTIHDQDGLWVVRAPGLLLGFTGGARPVIEDGWFAPRYGEKYPAPVISVRQHGRDADFLTLICPQPGPAPGDVPSLQWATASHGDCQAVVGWPRWQDRLTWPAELGTAATCNLGWDRVSRNGTSDLSREGGQS